MASKITVHTYNFDEVTTVDYEGDVDANVSPNGELLIIENRPDLGNENKGNPVKELKAIYNKGCWDRVEVE